MRFGRAGALAGLAAFGCDFAFRSDFFGAALRLGCASGSAESAESAACAASGALAVAASGRWWAAANNMIEPATAALSDAILPCIGMRMARSRRRLTGPLM